MHAPHVARVQALAFSAVLVFVAGCSSGATTGPTAAPTAGPTAAATDAASATPEPVAGADCPTVELKIAHGDPGLPSAFEQSAQFLAKRLSELTGGKVTAKTFPNAVLGVDQDLLTQVQAGSLDIGINATWSNAIKLATVVDLPFLFKDYAAWQKAMDGETGQVLKAAASGTGIKVLGLLLGGYRSTYGKSPITTMADLKGLKLRTQQSASFIALFEALGAIPTPMAFGEVYLALQQGTIDGAETALSSMIDAKHYEVAKYVAVTNHALGTVALTMSQKRWDSFSVSCQAVIQQAGDDAAKFYNQTLIDQEAAVIQKLTDLGETITYPDTAPAVEIARSQVYPKLVTEPDQKSLLDLIVNLAQ